MKNIDKMKQCLISHIQNMTIEEFYNFITTIEEDYDLNPDFMDRNALFLCDDCQSAFGRCLKDRDTHIECLDCFRKYAAMPNKLSRDDSKIGK